MEDCIFCKIIEGKIPASMVYQNSHSIAFLDISPINKGHALVVPKEHYTDLHSTPVEVLQAMIDAVQKVAKAVKKAVNADGINLGMNNGKAAGQIIFHAHMHVIPRFNDDGLHSWPHKKYEDSEIELFKEKIKKEMTKI